MILHPLTISDPDEVYYLLHAGGDHYNFCGDYLKEYDDSITLAEYGAFIQYIEEHNLDHIDMIERLVDNEKYLKLCNLIEEVRAVPDRHQRFDLFNEAIDNQDEVLILTGLIDQSSALSKEDHKDIAVACAFFRLILEGLGVEEKSVISETFHDFVSPEFKTWFERRSNEELFADMKYMNNNPFDFSELDLMECATEMESRGLCTVSVALRLDGTKI